MGWNFPELGEASPKSELVILLLEVGLNTRSVGLKYPNSGDSQCTKFQTVVRCGCVQGSAFLFAKARLSEYASRQAVAITLTTRLEHTSEFSAVMKGVQC